MLFILKTLGLFIVTAIAEIVGCYLPYLWLKQRASGWVLILAALSLGAFAWLLSLHPGAAGRTYAAYGGVYVSVALVWLWIIDGQRPDRLGRSRRSGGLNWNVDNRLYAAIKVRRCL
jgi:small multidrug resistance family-3 protein